MASSCYFMAFLISLMVVATCVSAYPLGDQYISPSLSPIADKICDDVECGKGSCKVDLGYRFNFRCVCDSGWKRTRLNNETYFQFLPCIIPECSLDYSCMPADAPSSAPAPALPYNVSIYDPCYWIYCGEGTCKWNKPYKHTCECRTGYYNALNISFYPCFSDCAIGSDCEKLGVVRASNSTSSTSTNGGTQATPFVGGNFLWISIFTVSIFIVLYK